MILLDLARQSLAPFGTSPIVGFLVFNNEWKKLQAGPQWFWVHSFHGWGVESTLPD